MKRLTGGAGKSIHYPLAVPAMALWLGMVMIELMAAPSGFAQTTPSREFVGTINDTLAIRIRLSQTDGVLAGSYFYEKVGKSLRLEGRIRNETDFSLTETDERGNPTGSFEGEFVSKDWIEGTWLSADKRKRLPFIAWVPGGDQAPTSTTNDKVSGQYQRMVRGKVDRHAATLNIWLLKDGRVRVKGDAIWVGDPKIGNVNTGDIDGIFSLQGSKILYENEDTCSFTVHLGTGSLTITDDNLRCGGMNVTFDGEYRKVGKPGSR